MEFDKEKILDENHDWYVAAKELYLPTHRLPKTEWSGSVTMYPTKSEAPYATTLMKVKTKKYKFKYTHVSGGKVFEAENKTYTVGAGNYRHYKTIAASQNFYYIYHLTVNCEKWGRCD